MNAKTKAATENTKRIINEIIEHKKTFGIPESLCLLTEMEYRDIVGKEAYFWMDHHERLRHRFSGEILAANQEQVDILIDQLQTLRKGMFPALDCTKEDK